MNAQQSVQLSHLNCQTPDDFVRQRRQLLDQAIHGNDETSARLAEFQQEIDRMIAVSGSPQLALQRLSADLCDRLTAMASLSRQLLAEMPQNTRPTAIAHP